MWRTLGRCSLPVAELSFDFYAWLFAQDEGLAAAAEAALSSLTVSDPWSEGNPLAFVSSGFCAMTGYSEAECLGKNCRFLQVRAAHCAKCTMSLARAERESSTGFGRRGSDDLL